jgi:hypothetical protein
VDKLRRPGERWSADLQSLERVETVARELLTITVDDGQRDLWLWERAERVMHLTQLVARIPELAGQAIDLAAVAAAGLFHCAGWVAQTQRERPNRWHLLTRPTSDIQRELGAALLQEHAAPLLPPKTARLAADAVRQCNDRGTSLMEAQILAEAEGLDDVGLMYVLRQLRLYQAEGRPLRQLLTSWQRQQEYHYWEARINDGFRFETTRQTARVRLQAVDVFMQSLGRELDGADLLLSLGQAGGKPNSKDTP